VFTTGFSGGDRDLLARTGAAADLVVRVYTELMDSYVDPLDPLKLAREAVRGMLSALDPFTVLVDERNRSEIEAITTGKYAGLGLSISYRDNKAIVSEFLAPTAVFNDEVHIGDEIVSIEGVDVRGKPEAEIRRMLKGEIGSHVLVELSRPGVEGKFPVNLQRRDVQLPTVSYAAQVEDSVAYIKLDRFSIYATDYVNRILDSLLKIHSTKGIIIDLRDNPGGLLNVAVDIAGMFLPNKTKVVTTAARNRSYASEHFTRRDPICPSLPLVVLINEGSASGSEIFAGAVQDYDRGVIAGTRSYGKGLVQNFITLDDVHALKITTSRYLTPTGRWIQRADYAERSKDTVILHEPRDTTRQFLTLMRHRPVREYGGIMPDVSIPSDSAPEWLTQLRSKGAIFDFVSIILNERQRNGSIDADQKLMRRFIEFVDSVSTRRGDDLALALGQMRKSLEREDVSEHIRKKLDSFAGDISSLRAQRITRHWQLIGKMIQQQVAFHSANPKTRFESTCRYDEQFRTALRIIQRPREYENILTSR
jgi:carboxyl-terminal processing protease